MKKIQTNTKARREAPCYLEIKRPNNTVQNFMLGDEGLEIKVTIWNKEIEKFQETGIELFDQVELKRAVLSTTPIKNRHFNRGSSIHELTIQAETEIRRLETEKSIVSFEKIGNLKTKIGKTVSIRGTVRQIEQKTSKKNVQTKWKEVKLSQKEGSARVMFWGQNMGRVNFIVGQRVAFIGAKVTEYEENIQIVANKYTKIVLND